MRDGKRQGVFQSPAQWSATDQLEGELLGCALWHWWKGDIAEQAAIHHALKRGWGVLRPIGDRLPYDLVFDVEGRLIRVQVKSAWLDPVKGNYAVDNRRTKTNRREMVREPYSPADFDFALAYLADLDLFYNISSRSVHRLRQRSTSWRQTSDSADHSLRDNGMHGAPWLNAAPM